MTTEELAAMVRLIQEISPLGLLSNMEARTIFELLQQRGFTITAPPTTTNPKD